MDAAALDRLRAALHARLDTLVAEGHAVVHRELDSPVASAADEDEAPYAEMDQALASGRNRERAALVEALRSALRRIAESPGDFGDCEDCGEAIPPRRLELLPWARSCVRCQEENDGPRGPARRRKVTDYA